MFTTDYDWWTDWPPLLEQRLEKLLSTAFYTRGSGRSANKVYFLWLKFYAWRSTSYSRLNGLRKLCVAKIIYEGTCKVFLFRSCISYGICWLSLIRIFIFEQNYRWGVVSCQQVPYQNFLPMIPNDIWWNFYMMYNKFNSITYKNFIEFHSFVYYNGSKNPGTKPAVWSYKTSNYHNANVEIVNPWYLY